MLIQADAFHLPYRDEYFHGVIFSPPYWGLRKYQGDQGDEPFGLESTPERHIERTVEYMREVRRVLRPDGVVWMNIGDCFSGAGGYSPNSPANQAGSIQSGRNQHGKNRDIVNVTTARSTPNPAGNLMLMPHRLAIALQSDGWIVRNDLVWFKRNPMPESVAGWRFESKGCDCVTKRREVAIAEAMEKGIDHHRVTVDEGLPGQMKPLPDCLKCHGTGKVGEPVLRKSSWRHTRAHEYVFQLTKSMGYYCNQEAVREGNDRQAGPQGNRTTFRGGYDGFSGKDGQGGNENPMSGRNPRSVLDVPTAPYKGAHYATFPPKLIAPLIRASVPRRCCPECGMAWAPVVEKAFVGTWHDHSQNLEKGARQDSGGPKSDFERPTVTDYRPTCECGVTQHEPGIVLDIFGGSGTTGMVAKQLMRRWVVMDISRPYLDEQAKVRTGTGTPSGALEGLPMFGGEDETK